MHNLIYIAFFAIIAFVGLVLMVRNKRVNKVEAALIAVAIFGVFVLLMMNSIIHNAGVDLLVLLFIVFALTVYITSAVRQSLTRNRDGDA